MMMHPLSALPPWFSLPVNIAKAFTANSSLPVHELDKAKVQTPRAHVRPFPDACGVVSFSAWRLAHAIKKADCLRWPSAPQLWAGATGFLLENGHLFNWGKAGFSLHDGMANYYADFSSSGLAGRIGQGMAILFLEEKGYAYVGRFETEWKQRAATQNKAWPAGKEKAPDFIAENTQKEWILAESKAGFAGPDSKPNIKGALNEGLKQLDGWDKHISPQPKKSFAIGTFLRESNDGSDEKSMIAFVDPEPEPPENPVEFPADTIRRANYAAWLAAMGFNEDANRLRTGAYSADRRRQTVPVISLGGRQFVVRITSILPKSPDLSSREFWEDFQDLPYLLFKLRRYGFRIEVIGLDLKVFESLVGGESTKTSARLMDFSPQQTQDATFDLEGGAFTGSIFSDGSVLGELRHSRAGRGVPNFEWIEVDL